MTIGKDGETSWLIWPDEALICVGGVEEGTSKGVSTVGRIEGRAEIREIQNSTVVRWVSRCGLEGAESCACSVFQEIQKCAKCENHHLTLPVNPVSQFASEAVSQAIISDLV